MTAGDVVAAEDPVITLESDKATLDVPASAAGTVSEVAIRVGDRVSAGDLILRLDAGPASDTPAAAPVRERVTEDAAPAPAEPPGYGSPSGIYEVIEVTVPDIGHFIDVPVIEVHAAAGDLVAREDPLITLESDKATLDIPAPVTGTITAVRVAVGDQVSAGHVIADLRTGETAVPEPAAPATSAPTALATPAVQRSAPGNVAAEVLVLGAGPGGYTAAFRAADLGKKVALVDRGPTLGADALRRLNPVQGPAARREGHRQTKEMREHGIMFGAPVIDIGKLRAWKDGVVGRLTGGLAGLTKQRKVTTIRGYGRFTSPHQLRVELAEGGVTTVDFEQAIIAAVRTADAAIHPVIGPADHRLHRRAGTR